MDATVEVIEELILFCVVAHNAELVRGETDSCQNRIFCTEFRKTLQKVFDVGFSVAVAFVRTIQQECRLRQVRDNDIGFGAESCHCMGEFRSEARIKSAVVRHDWIDKHEILRCPEFVDEAGYEFQLFERTEITGIDGVKADFFRFPVCCNGSDITGKIAESEVFEHRVSGENGCRKHGTFDSHCGNDRQCHCKGTFADTGNILNRYNSFHFTILDFQSVVYHAESFDSTPPFGIF